MLDSTEFLTRALVEEGVIDEAGLSRARQQASEQGGSVVEALVSLRLATSRQIALTRATICEYPLVDLSHYEIDHSNALLLPRALAERVGAFPLFVLGGCATVGMVDPLDLTAIDQVRQVLRREVEPVLCEPEQLAALISRAFSLSWNEHATGGAEDPGTLTKGDEPIVAAVNEILSSAAEAGASDIHINPDETQLHLRYRVDGVLAPQQGPAKALHASLAQRLKVMAKLDVTQTRRPQDGKFRFQHRGQPIDVRLSLVPTVHGENVVMRLLRPAGSIGRVHDLGMPSEMERWFEDMIERPHGMILVTGPTGSGKTTTLYTALHHINRPEVNIMTAEDPVEIRLPLIRQVQMNHEIGLDFASALRSFLRQDPDVILVGEIRDGETGRIAVQAALTGHLVFSTLHTNDACGAVARLRDLGVPPFAINNAVLGVIAQRLVRRVCTDCARADAIDGARLETMGIAAGDGPFTRGAGCPRCLGTGYKGRLAVFEMLRVTPRVKALIEADETTSRITSEARVEGMRTMWDDGLEKARRGLTSVDELSKLRGAIEVGAAEDLGPIATLGAGAAAA